MPKIISQFLIFCLFLIIYQEIRSNSWSNSQGFNRQSRVDHNTHPNLNQVNILNIKSLRQEIPKYARVQRAEAAPGADIFHKKLTFHLPPKNFLMTISIKRNEIHPPNFMMTFSVIDHFLETFCPVQHELICVVSLFTRFSFLHNSGPFPGPCRRTGPRSSVPSDSPLVGPEHRLLSPIRWDKDYPIRLLSCILESLRLCCHFFLLTIIRKDLIKEILSCWIFYSLLWLFQCIPSPYECHSNQTISLIH